MMTTERIKVRARDIKIDELAMTFKTVQLQPGEIIAIEIDLPLMREQVEQVRARVDEALVQNNIKAVPLIMTATLKVVDVHEPNDILAKRFMDMQEQNARMMRVFRDLTSSFYYYKKEPQARQLWLKQIFSDLERADKLLEEMRGCTQEELEKE